MAKSSARRRQIARAKWERQQQARVQHEAARRSRERLAIGFVVVALVGVVAGLGLRQLVDPTTVASRPSSAPAAVPSTPATGSATSTSTPTPTATS